MIQKINGKRPGITVYDESGDVRLLTEAEREELLRTWEAAKPKLDKDFARAIVFGTPNPHGEQIKEEDIHVHDPDNNVASRAIEEMIKNQKDDK